MEILLPLIGGAVGAALINGIVALYALRRANKSEHWQWLREKRLMSYVVFLDSCRDLDKFAWDAHTKSRKAREVELAQLIQSVQTTQMRLLAPKQVTVKMDKMLESVVDLARQATRRGYKPTQAEFKAGWDEYIQIRGSVGELIRNDLNTLNLNKL